ncbi:MAG: NAD(P)H-dependent oxidoreductase [Burkholderiaceae bacterium]|jgi:putative NADPH-quinone reductase|nr:NAD(P)H-dependent oxidoreductase [Burkholderiaceae bacterium]
MSRKRILLIQGHPDPRGGHFGQALAQAYADGAAEAGHALRRIEVAQLDFPVLRSADDWEHGSLPEALKPAQDDIAWAQHLVVFFPLWLGDMPALLKAFLEQVARPGFAFHDDGNGGFGKKGLAGRSARVVVTMGMPALVYRYFFRAHSLKSLERNVLGFVGIAPVHETLIGMVERLKTQERERRLGTLRALGRKAA